MSLEIEMSNVHIDGEKVPVEDFEILLQFVCDFVVRVAGIEVFREVEFPFIEFASQVASWLRSGGLSDFDYESMDSAVKGLVYFHRKNGHAEWDVGSSLLGSVPPQAVTTEELRQCLDEFLALVAVAGHSFRVDVRRFVERTPGEAS